MKTTLASNTASPGDGCTPPAPHWAISQPEGAPRQLVVVHAVPVGRPERQDSAGAGEGTHDRFTRIARPGRHRARHRRPQRSRWSLLGGTFGGGRWLCAPLVGLVVLAGLILLTGSVLLADSVITMLRGDPILGREFGAALVQVLKDRPPGG